MMLLAPELLSTALCAESSGMELGPVDAIGRVNAGKLHGDMRAKAAV